MKAKAKKVAGRFHFDSKLEARYCREILEPQEKAGAISDVRHQALRIRLADGSFYTPDFWFKDANGEIHAVEVKGYHKNMRDSLTKWKTAAELLPWFHWHYVTWRNKASGWMPRTYGDKT